MRGKRENAAQIWSGKVLLTGVSLVILSFLLPLFLAERFAPAPAVPLPVSPISGADPFSPSAPCPTPRAGWDEQESLLLLQPDGSVTRLTMAEYLQGVVRAEMPVSFLPEALKAQAVAARTYCLYQRAQNADKHLQADVCTDSTCCQAWLDSASAAEKWGEEADRYADKIAQAVSDTDGLVCLYQGELIDAVFFSSALGKTSSAGVVWGKDVPYLASVNSPEGEEVPELRTVVTFPKDEFIGRFLTAHPEASFSDTPEHWIGVPETDDAGAVLAISIGGVTVTGGEVRSLYGLRSTRFQVETGENIIFSVSGYGHGVGMSQYGANALARQGKTFAEILQWYYTGVTVAGAP